MKIINKILNYIDTFISVYIVMPIHAWFNYYFKHKAIEDNIRNQQLIDYLQRVAKDGTTEPQTPVEHFVEKELKDSCDTTLEKYKEMLLKEYDGKLPSYEEIRSECAREIVLEMMSYIWVEPERWDDE